MKAIIRHVGLYVPELMTPKLEKLLEEAEISIKKGEASRSYDNAGDFLKDLRS